MEEDSVDLAFHGVQYNLAVTAVESAAPEGTLAVDLEELGTGRMWHGEFAASYVEKITSKTGSLKKFSVFLRMLLGALRQQSDTVFLDLLTFADLDALKAKKAGAEGGDPPAPKPGPPNTKRYLILTYVVEFDRVHYPLPLVLEEGPTVGAQGRLIRRLRRELHAARGAGGASAADVHVQLQAAQAAAAGGEEALEKLRAASRAEVKRLRGEVAALTAGVEEARAAGALAASTARESEVLTQLRATNEQLRGKLQELTRQLALSAGGGEGGGRTPGRGQGTASGATPSVAARGRALERRTPGGGGTPASASRPASQSSRRGGSSVGSRTSAAPPAAAKRAAPAPSRPANRSVTPTTGRGGPSVKTPVGGGSRAAPAPRSTTPSSVGRSTLGSRGSGAGAGAKKDLAAYGAPYGQPVRSGSNTSRGSTPGRASVSTGGSRGGVVSRGSVTLPGPLSGLSPITARIYSQGLGKTGQGSGRGTAAPPSPTAARAAVLNVSSGSTAGSGSVRGASPAPSAGGRRAHPSTTGGGQQGVGMAYKGAVEPFLAGLEAQRGTLARLHQSPSEVSEIDAKLAQLQEYLRAAKAGGPLPELTVGSA